MKLFYLPLVGATLAAQGIITTIAGGYLENVPGTQARMEGAFGIAVDARGNVYFTDSARIRKLDRNTGIVSTVAGGAPNPELSGDGPAMQVRINPSHLGIAPNGRLLFLDGQCLRQIDLAAFVVRTIAGFCRSTLGVLGSPTGMALDRAGNAFLTSKVDGVDRVLRVDAQTSQVTIYAGSIPPSYNADGIPRTAFSFTGLGGIALDTSGTVFVGSRAGLHRIDAKSGAVTTVPYGQGQILPTTNVIAAAPSGHLYLGGVGRIYKFDPTSGNTTIVAGTGLPGYDGENVLPTQAKIGVLRTLAVDQAGNLWLPDSTRIRMVSVATGLISTAVGTARNGDGGPARGALLEAIVGIAFDAGGNLFISDGDRIRRVDRITGQISTFAGGGANMFGENLPLLDARLDPSGLVFNCAGDLLFLNGSRIGIIRSGSGVVTSFAGTIAPGFSGDNGPASNAALENPTDLAIDRACDVFVSDSNGTRIRKIDRSGIIRTVAGSGGGGSGEISAQGPALNAAIVATGLAVDPQNRLVFTGGGYVQRLEPDGRLAHMAGTGFCDNSGDGGPVRLSPVCAKRLAVDERRNIFADLRRIDTGTTIIQTVAGGGTSGADGISATSAVIEPTAMTPL